MSDMTRKETIAILKNMLAWMKAANSIVSKYDRIEALEYAIASLEKDQAEQPQFCEDCISREQADKAIQELAYYYQNEFLKPSNAVHEAAMGGRMFGASKAREIVVELPSVLPKRLHATWDYVQYDANSRIGNYHCSNCRAIFQCENMDFEYCPHCGAKMDKENTDVRDNFK